MPKRSKITHKHADLQARLGAAVRECRKQLGITQEELAWRADMHRTYIADIERGARNVTVRSIAKLAEALQVSVVEFFKEASVTDGAAMPLAAKSPR